MDLASLISGVFPGVMVRKTMQKNSASKSDALHADAQVFIAKDKEESYV